VSLVGRKKLIGSGLRKISSGGLAIVGRSSVPQEYCKTYTLVEEIKVEDRERRRGVKIEELGRSNEGEDCLIDMAEEEQVTPIYRRRSSNSFLEEIYDEDEELDDDDRITYRRKDVVVQFPDDVNEEVEGEEVLDQEINENVRKSLTEEEQMSGKLLLEQIVQTYWNDVEQNRVGYYPGVIKSYRIFNNDIQYEVKYDNGITFWEIIDDGVLFADEKMEEIKKKIIEIRKTRGTFSMIPIRRKIQRSLRRRMSGITNGTRKRLLSQTSKKRKFNGSDENTIKRRKLISS